MTICLYASGKGHRNLFDLNLFHAQLSSPLMLPTIAIALYRHKEALYKGIGLKNKLMCSALSIGKEQVLVINVAIGILLRCNSIPRVFANSCKQICKS